jgi:alkanesulfonate monooxygenase SsuD/methylene tetrahydromethanopterin reductase-like flavin-dependent oxidoreductase (luciferase family)
MARSVLIPEGYDDVASFAQRAESLGYPRLWVGELWGRDAFVALARAATEVDDLDLGTAIVNVYGRSPATLAQAAATLDGVADGDVLLGVGTSTPKAIEDLHGVPFDNPPRRLHETVELAREFLAGDGRVDYDGELFDVADFPALGAEVPVYTAALGPANRRATGRTADGWLPHNVPWGRMDEAFELVAETAREAGRDPADIDVAPYVPSAVSDDHDAAVQRIEAHLAYYVGSGEGYKRAVAQQFPEEAERVAEAWRDGDRDAAREAVTREMVDALGVAGTPDEARRQLDEVASVDAIDETIVVVPAGTSEEMTRQTVAALAPQ